MTPKVDSLVDRRKALEEQRMERIMRARERGLLIFLAKTDDGKDTTNVDIRCAILGLDEKIVRFIVREAAVDQKIGNVLDALRQEVNRLDHCAKIWRAYEANVRVYEENLRAWQATPFWRRRRMPRPTPPELPLLPEREPVMNEPPTKVPKLLDRWKSLSRL